MMPSIFVFLASVISMSYATGVVDMYGIINTLYMKADRDGDGTITISELDGVYQGFDANGDGSITKAEFVSLWQLLTHQTKEHAEAFFFLADLTDDGVIDQKDLGPMYHIFDLDGDGKVTAQEFGQKWIRIIRETPFTVLFVRSDQNKDNGLTDTEFRNFFTSFDTDNDQQVTKQEMETAWSTNGFADTVKDADVLFAKLDFNNDGFITGQDMHHWFTQYDLNHDHKLDIIETVKMYLLLPPMQLN